MLMQIKEGRKMKSFKKISDQKLFPPFLTFLSHTLLAADYHSHLYFTVIKHHVMAQQQGGG